MQIALGVLLLYSQLFFVFWLLKILIMKNALLLFSLFATITVKTQDLVSTHGDSYSNAISNIDLTIGEVIINTGTDGINDITQGFHQTNWNFVEVEDYSPSYEATIFPNPTSDILTIITSMFENMTYAFYDAQGKLIFQDKLSAEQTSLQGSQFASGSYSLNLSNETQNLRHLN